MGILFFYGLVVGIVAGVIIEHFVFRKETPTDNDPDGKIKKQIFDTLTKLKKDIEETV